MSKCSKEISIIIATFNAGKTLARCLNSISYQKTESVEVIIVDGGSDDNTLDIVRNSNVVNKFISEKDKGIYDAWNKGIKMSSGKWIVFLGADDMLCDNCIAQQLEYLKNNDTNNIDIISGMAWLCDGKGKTIKSMGEPYKWNHFRWQMNISHGSTLHFHKLFLELGLFDINFKICGDYEFLLRRPLNSAFINSHLIRMTDGGASTTFKARRESYLARKKNRSVPCLINLMIYFREYWGYKLKHLFAK